METLIVNAQRLLSHVDLRFQRYAMAKINWQNRLIGLLGPRGVGKTTLVLQYIKQYLPVQQTLYVTAEDYYFASHRLTDLASEFVAAGGRYLFIDEIHKYPDWAKALKLIYDQHPSLQIVFTGSSVLDIKKGTADLSRRAVIYTMQGLSFREYLELVHQIKIRVHTLQELTALQVSLPPITGILPLFRQYLERGYYPFAIEEDFDIKLMQVMSQTLEVDIPSFAQMNVSTGRKLKQLLAIVAQSVPFKPNMSKIAMQLNIGRNNLVDYFLFMEEAGMLLQLRSQTQGISALGKVEKVYLDNSNLLHVLAAENANLGNIRETFFLNQTRVLHEVRSSVCADFYIDGIDFEVGGKNKGLKQIKLAPKGIVVKDDLEQAYLNVLPLWYFGLLY